MKPFHSFKCLINIYLLMAEVLNEQNLFTELNLGDWFLSYVQFYSVNHFSDRAVDARKSGKVNHLKVCSINFDLPANYVWATWHVFPPKYNAWTHFNNLIAAIYYCSFVLGKFRQSFVLESVPSRWD